MHRPVRGASVWPFRGCEGGMVDLLPQGGRVTPALHSVERLTNA